VPASTRWSRKSPRSCPAKSRPRSGTSSSPRSTRSRRRTPA